MSLQLKLIKQSAQKGGRGMGEFSSCVVGGGRPIVLGGGGEGWWRRLSMIAFPKDRGTSRGVHPEN